MEKRPVELRGILTLNHATFSEMAGLIIALHLADTGKLLAGIFVLFLSQLSERIAVIMVTDEAYVGRSFPRNFFAPVIVSAYAEGSAWIIWFALWNYLPLPGIGPIVVATLALFVMQLYQHSWLMSIVVNKPPFSRYATDPITIVFSAVEALTAGAWLLVARSDHLFWAAIVLLVGLSIEHLLQVLVYEKALPPNFVE